MKTFSLFCFVIVVGGLINAFGLSVLWGWFAVPLFGLPSLSLAQSYGVCLVAGFLTSSAPDTDDSKDVGDTLIKGLLYVVVKVVLSLSAGLVAVQFI